MKYLMRVKNSGMLLISFTLTSACAGPISPQVIGRGQSNVMTAQTPSGTVPDAVDTSNDASVITAGMRIYLDPQTGEVATPPPAVAAQSQKQSLQTVKPAVTELYETLSPTPGGGFMVELKDQFHSPVTATVDADGKVSVQH
jgi:hypothetical protein